MGTEYPGVPCLFVVDAVEQAVLYNRHACGSEFVGRRLHRGIAVPEEQPLSKHCSCESAAEQLEA